MTTAPTPTLNATHYTTLRGAIYHAHDVAEATGRTVYVRTDPDNPARYVVTDERPDPAALVCAVNPPPF